MVGDKLLMKISKKQLKLQQQLMSLYKDYKTDVFSEDRNYIAEKRMHSIKLFEEKGFPTINEEAWKGTNLSKALSNDYHHLTKADLGDIDLDKLFQCDVRNFDTDLLSLLNGWLVNGSAELKTLPNGTIIGSMAEAMKKLPEFIDKYYNKSEKINEHSLSTLNTSMAQDGVFIYVPDNVEPEKAIQLVSIINYDKSLFVQTRNLIILGKNSKLRLVQCDDTTNQLASFNNSVTEVFADEGAKLDHYKLQNINNNSTLVNTIYIKQEANSNVSTNAITLNGGLIRNNVYIKLNGQGADADVLGVYLMDKKQHVDNHIFIDHSVPNCTSNELFKGILDEESSAVFNGHILVQQDAQNTNAFQNNKNILLTDTASIDTKPFLEIYADDVKCSHGATIGQLDTEAMFYLRQRGITEDNARMLLMYAFAADVIKKISIAPLRDRIDDMVKKRLRGELSICDTCVLHCSNPEKKIEFNINLNKL
jgi:Fe-S cluster assembly protein SufD